MKDQQERTFKMKNQTFFLCYLDTWNIQMIWKKTNSQWALDCHLGLLLDTNTELSWGAWPGTLAGEGVQGKVVPAAIECLLSPLSLTW
jgi:hypothetical protein